MTDTSDPPKSPLGKIARRVLGGVGGALTTAGSVAVFVQDTNVAGVPLLIAAGAAFIYVALTGQRLVQVTKDGVTFGQEQMEGVLDDVEGDPAIPDEAKSRVIEHIEDNGIVVDQNPSVHLEQVAGKALERLGQQHSFGVQVPYGTNVADFVLTNVQNEQVAVEVLAQPKLRQLSAAVRRLRTSGYTKRLIIVFGSAPPELTDAFRRDAIWVVGFNSNGLTAVTDALAEMGFITRGQISTAAP